MSDIEKEAGQVGFSLDTQLFSNPVPAYFDTSDRYIHKGSNLLGGNVHFHEGAEAQFSRSETGIA